MKQQKKWCVYKHTNIKNGKIYIGQTCQEPERRWGNGISAYCNNDHFVSAIKKYGWENFSHEILKDNLTEQEMKYWENFYIRYYDTLDPNKGYNLVQGGLSSPFTSLWKDPVFREERSKAQSQIMKNRFKNKEERKKVSERNKKYWETHPEAKQRQSKIMSARLVELWKDDQYRNKQSEKMKQYTRTHKEQMSSHNSKNAYKNWQNPEYRKKICKEIRNIETGLVFESAAAAARWCGLADRSSITKHLTQHTKSAGKHPETKEPLHWEYIE